MFSYTNKKSIEMAVKDLHYMSSSGKFKSQKLV